MRHQEVHTASPAAYSLPQTAPAPPLVSDTQPSQRRLEEVLAEGDVVTLASWATADKGLEHGRRAVVRSGPVRAFGDDHEPARYRVRVRRDTVAGEWSDLEAWFLGSELRRVLPEGRSALRDQLRVRVGLHDEGVRHVQEGSKVPEWQVGTVPAFLPHVVLPPAPENDEVVEM